MACAFVFALALGLALLALVASGWATYEEVWAHWPEDLHEGATFYIAEDAMRVALHRVITRCGRGSPGRCTAGRSC